MSLSLVLTLQGSDTSLAFCSSVWGPVRVAHPFHPSLLLGGVLVRLCGGPFCRSMAMSWRAILFSLLRSRLSIPFAMSPLSRRVFTDSFSPLRVVALAEGRLPMLWVPSEPMGFTVAPPLSPYIGPGQSPQFYRSPLGAQVGVSYFSCASFCMYLWRSIWSISLTYVCPNRNIPLGLCYLDT